MKLSKSSNSTNSKTNSKTNSNANSSPADTRERLLDAAELLFIERGYSGTSVRAIATAAKVNLAASNYHFGSKRGLFSAVFHRRIKPINEARLLSLKTIKDSDRSLTVEGILEAFFEPFTKGTFYDQVPRLIARLYSEPESISKSIMEEEFSEVANTFRSALGQVLPDVSAEELKWRFHFMIGSMIHTLQFRSPIGDIPSPEKLKFGMSQLRKYCIAGLAQPASENNSSNNNASNNNVSANNVSAKNVSQNAPTRLPQNVRNKS